MKVFYNSVQTVKRVPLDYNDVVTLLLKDKPKIIYCKDYPKGEPFEIIYKYLPDGVVIREYYNDGYGDNGYNKVFITWEKFYNERLDSYSGLLETLYY